MRSVNVVYSSILFQPRTQVIGNTANVGEVPEEFKPPDWLTETVPHKAPYYPQIGDEIMYFRQGHENYVRMCKHRKAYDINPKKNQPWHKTDLRVSIMFYHAFWLDHFVTSQSAKLYWKEKY